MLAIISQRLNRSDYNDKTNLSEKNEKTGCMEAMSIEEETP